MCAVILRRDRRHDESYPRCLGNDAVYVQHILALHPSSEICTYSRIVEVEGNRCLMSHASVMDSVHRRTNK